MKKVIFLLLIVLCSCGSRNVQTSEESPQIVPEIVYVEDTTRVTELEERIRVMEDSLKFYRDSIPYDTYINARRIEKIKYYISITEKKPTNQKFFYGWVRRTMSE